MSDTSEVGYGAYALVIYDRNVKTINSTLLAENLLVVVVPKSSQRGRAEKDAHVRAEAVSAKRQKAAFTSRIKNAVGMNKRSSSSSLVFYYVIPDEAGSSYSDDEDDDESENELGEDGEICFSQTKKDLMHILIVDFFLPLANKKQIIIYSNGVFF